LIRTHRAFLLCPRLETLLHLVRAHPLLLPLAVARAEVVVVAAEAVVPAAVVAEAADPLFRPLGLRVAEAYWWPGTPSLRKKHGAGDPARVRASTPAGHSQLLEISCFPMSIIACMHSRPTRVSRFSTSQPEWGILVLQSPSCSTVNSTSLSPVPLVVEAVVADAVAEEAEVAVVVVAAVVPAVLALQPQLPAVLLAGLLVEQALK